MSAQVWTEWVSQSFAEDGQNASTLDDDAALDDWLASLTVPQFDGIMNFLMEQVYEAQPMMDRPVA